MVARRFQVVHNDSNFDVEYDTDDGFEVSMPTFLPHCFRFSLRCYCCTSNFVNSCRFSKSSSSLSPLFPLMSKRSRLRFVGSLSMFVCVCLYAERLESLFVDWNFSVQIYGSEDDRLVASDSDLAAFTEKLRLVSISEQDEQGESSKREAEMMKSDEELARLLQVLPALFRAVDARFGWAFHIYLNFLVDFSFLSSCFSVCVFRRKRKL